MEGDQEHNETRSFHSRLAKIREKMFRNEEAGLSLEGFLDALGAGQDDPATESGPGTPSRLLTPVRGSSAAASAHTLGLKDSDARIKSDLAEYRSLMVNRGDFEEVAVLGRGHFATVSLVREKVSVHSASSSPTKTRGGGGKVYAMKKMSKGGVPATRARLERTVMSRAKSDWLVKLRFAFQDSRFLYLVMEYCPGGDLRTLLDRHDGKLSEDMARFYLAEMTLAIHTVHLMGYVHRDIKPENVLLDRFGHIKLADFGSAELVTSISKNLGTRPVGTPNYVSPEILQCLDANRSDEFDPRKSDYWSLGVVGFEMVVGHTPFADEKNNVVNTYSNIMSNTYNKAMNKLHPELRDLLQGLLTDVEKRWGYDQLVRHEFFISVDWDGLSSSCAPFVPDLKDSFDTSHFDEARHAACPDAHFGASSSLGSKKHFDPVVGFSYAGKHSESVRYSRQFGGEDYSDMVSSLRRQNEDLRLKVARLEKERTKERRESAVKLALEADRRGQDEARQLRESVRELEGLLAVEREERKVTESKSLELLTEVRKKWEAREEARVDKIDKELKRSEARRELMEQELKKALDAAEAQKSDLKAALEVKASLKAKLKECKGKLEVTFGRYEEEVQKVKDLKEQSSLLAEATNRTAELERSVLAKDLGEEKERADALKAEVRSLKKELDKARSVDRDQKETLQFLRAEKEVAEGEQKDQVRKLNREKEKLEDKTAQLIIKLAQLEGECESASIRMKDKDRKLEELGRVLERLENKIKPIDKLPPPTPNKETEEELKRARDDLSLQKVEVRLLERKNKELEDRIKWRVEMSRDEREERNKLEKEAKEAKEKAKESEKLAEKAKEELDLLERLVPALEKEIETLKKTAASLRLREEEGADAKRRLDSLQGQLEESKSRAKKASDLSDTNAKLKATCLELQDQLAEYETVLEKVEAQLNREKSTRERFESETAERSMEVSELRIERNELKSRLALSESQAKAARAKQEDFEAAFRRQEEDLGERLNKASGARAEQEIALRRLRDQVDHLASESERSSGEAAALREQNLQIKEESAELTTSVRSLKDSNLRLNAVVEESLRKIERRNGELVRAREALQSLQEDKERRDNENAVHIEQLRKLIEHLRGKCAALEAQLGLGGKKSGKKRPAETNQLLLEDLQHLRTPGGGLGRSRSPAKTPRESSRSPMKSPPRKAFR